MPSAVISENYILFLNATDTTKSKKHRIRMRKKGFMDEQSYPEFYVKLNPFFPVFPKPYSYYQDAAFEEKTPKVKFNDKGEAVIRLYNNSKKTVIAVEAEGITTDGKPVVWKSETDNTYPR